ncbi:hypothetical protein GCM10023065_24840 [Microbacterium laevaniformans]|nr:hypothetical protein GCM10017578_24480 [Microbacterium laevaniformans]
MAASDVPAHALRARAATAATAVTAIVRRARVRDMLFLSGHPRGHDDACGARGMRGTYGCAVSSIRSGGEPPVTER